MKHSRFVVLSLLVLMGLLGLWSCGGGTAGFSTDSLTPAVDSFKGISAGDFKAIRFNDAGYRDSALNPTLDLQSVTSGDVTTVTIAVNDTDPMYGVAMELIYDTSKYTPEKVEFGNLISTPVEMASTRTAGLVALGQVDINGVSRRSGDFAVVTFNAGALRTVSAAGDAHSVLMNRTYDPAQLTIAGADGFTLTKATAEAGDPAVYSIYNIFMVGDADDNGESNIADLTPMIAYGNYGVAITDANLATAVTDFSGDGETNISDLTPLGQHLQEVTTGIEIVLGDSATFTGGETPLATLAWADGAGGVRPPVATADWGDIWRAWGGTVTQAECLAADTNTDGTVFISARPTNGTTAFDTFPGLAITAGPPPPENVIVTDFTAEIPEATGGSGAGGAFEAGDTASVVANSSLTLEVTGISGTYNAIAFDPTDLITSGIPQADYDDSLAIVQAAIMWSAANAGAAGMERTADVLLLSAGTGSPITGTVFPDDDPLSTAATPEGTLNITLASSGTFIPAGVSKNIGVDVTADPTAAVFNMMRTDVSQDLDNNWLMNQATDTLITIGFDWGTGGVPGDLLAVQGFLFDFDAMTEIELTNVSPGLNSNEFNIVENNPPDPTITGAYRLSAKVGGGTVVPGHTYMFRIGVPPFTSVNKPREFLVAAPLPPPVAFEYLPVEAIGPDNDLLTLFYPDPMLRRDPTGVFNPLNDSFTPTDAAAFADIIKQSGGSFPMNFIEGIKYPRITVVAGDTPSSIGPGTASIAGILVQSPGTDPGKMQIFIGAVTPSGGGVGDPPVDYAFKAYGAFNAELGEGTFTFNPGTVPDPAPPAIGEWGVNVFDGSGRGDLAKDARDMTNWIVDGSDVLTPTPPVVFFEAGGGYTGQGDNTLNVQIRIHSDTRGDMTWLFEPRILGLDGAGMLLMSHTVVAENFIDPIMPGGGPGKFVPGDSYDVILTAPQFPGQDQTYPDQLVVVGVNPNL